MPSSSAAQHRWIGYLHSNPEARAKSGMSEAKVSEWLHADRGNPWKHASGGIIGRDMGGATDPNAGTGIGGPTPAQTANPLAQNMLQRYSAYPTEKLAEMAAQMGGTSQGQMIQKLLMQRRMTPQQAQPQPQQQQPQGQGIAPPQTPQIAPQAPQPLARGGIVKRDMGGGMGMPSGILNEDERINARQDSGFLHGATPGRADQIKTQAPPGAYVMPADVIAGLGEGNSLSGARIMQSILASGPYGTPLPRAGRGSGAPRPPSVASAEGRLKSGGTIPIFNPQGRAGGGANTGSTPVDLSDGEYVISPEDCERFGQGDRTRGHRFLDKWVIHLRKKHIAKLKSLPGPVVPRGKPA
jgi:hypothetical protein